MAQDNFNYGTPLKGVNRRQGILDELKGMDMMYHLQTLHPAMLQDSRR